MVRGARRASPRRRRGPSKGNKRGTQRKTQNTFVRYNCPLLATFSASGTLQRIPVDVSNALSDRVNDLAPYYQFYRHVRLSVTILPTVDSTTPGNVVALAYTPNEAGVTDITLFDQAAVAACRVLHAVPKTTNTVLVVPRGVLLATPVSRFAVNTAATEYPSIQGHLSIVPRASATMVVTMMITGEIELMQATQNSGADDFKLKEFVSIDRLRWNRVAESKGGDNCEKKDCQSGVKSDNDALLSGSSSCGVCGLSHH